MLMIPPKPNSLPPATPRENQNAPSQSAAAHPLDSLRDFSTQCPRHCRRDKPCPRPTKPNPAHAYHLASNAHPNTNCPRKNPNTTPTHSPPCHTARNPSAKNVRPAKHSENPAPTDAAQSRHSHRKLRNHCSNNS